jgi:hypothetical protein
MAQGRHARPELIGRHQMLLVGFDQARDSNPNPGQPLSRDTTLDAADMVGAQFRQPAINLGADQRGLAEQRDPTARGACRAPAERIAAQLTDQQALGERALLGVTGCELSVLLATLP